MSDGKNTAIITLSVGCAVLLVLFILALTDKGGLDRMGNKKSKMDSKKKVNGGKSRFYASRSNPQVTLPRRPVNERTAQQNQMNEDLSSLKLSTDQVEELDPLQAYDPARLSLEKSVYDSHREFVEDAYVSTQGANSTDSVRSDAQDINPRVGLRKVDYTSAFSEADARVVSSESPDQIAQRNSYFVI